MPKILIVKDNEMNRDVLSRRLERSGFEGVILPLGVKVLVDAHFRARWAIPGLYRAWSQAVFAGR